MALILRADHAMTNPPAGAPQIGNIQDSLVLEYDAAALATPHGSALTSWPSTSGALPFAGVTAGGTWPRMLRPAGSAAAAVSFTAADKTAINTAFNYAPPLTDATAVLVLRPDSVHDSRVLSMLPASGAYFRHVSLKGGQVQVGALDSTEQDLGQFKAGAWQVIQVSMAAGSTRTKLNSAAVRSLAALPAGTTAGLRLGATGALTGLFNGDLALLRIYSRALTDAELAVHASYLTSRFNIK